MFNEEGVEMFGREGGREGGGNIKIPRPNTGAIAPHPCFCTLVEFGLPTGGEYIISALPDRVVKSMLRDPRISFLINMISEMIGQVR